VYFRHCTCRAKVSSNHNCSFYYILSKFVRLIPGAFPGATVATPFGLSKVVKIRPDAVHIARPVNWKLANDSKATLFLQPDQVKLAQEAGFKEGDEVITVYGQGYIEKVRASDLVVKLNDWKLAQGDCMMFKCILANNHYFRSEPHSLLERAERG